MLRVSNIQWCCLGIRQVNTAQIPCKRHQIVSNFARVEACNCKQQPTPSQDISDYGAVSVAYQKTFELMLTQFHEQNRRASGRAAQDSVACPVQSINAPGEPEHREADPPALDVCPEPLEAREGNQSRIDEQGTQQNEEHSVPTAEEGTVKGSVPAIPASHSFPFRRTVDSRHDKARFRSQSSPSRLSSTNVERSVPSSQHRSQAGVVSAAGAAVVSAHLSEPHGLSLIHI